MGISAALFTACGGNDDNSASSAPSDIIGGGVEVDPKLKENKEKWGSSGVENYSYSMLVGCWDCNERQIFRVIHKDGKDTVLTLPYNKYEEVEGYTAQTPERSFEDIYKLIENAPKNGYLIKRTIYDPELGFPSYVFVDFGGSNLSSYEVFEFEKEDSGLDEYYTAQNNWITSGVNYYSFTLNVDCECPISGDIKIQVQSDFVKSAYLVNEQRALSQEEIDRTPLQIPQLLRLVRNAIKNGQDYEVEYEDHYGYPVTFSIDKNNPQSNSQFAMSIRDFKVEAASSGIEELNLQQSKWNSFGFNDYRYTYRKTLAASDHQYFRVQVQGSVEQANAYFEDDDYTEVGSNVQSIAELFDLIRDAFLQDYSKVKVRYHTVYGYPTSIDLDEQSIVAGDEVIHSVSEFLTNSRLDEFYAQLKKWQDERHNDYQFSLTQLCDCEINGLIDFVINPTDGVSANYVEGNRLLTDDETKALGEGVYGIFERLKSSLLNQDETVEVSYSSLHGFPEYFYVTNSLNSNSSAVQLTVSEMVYHDL